MVKTQAEMMIGQKVLITTDMWFTAPDGKTYSSVYGNLIGVFGDKEITGLKTNAKSTNWYAQVGGMIIAGCQIHYVINCQDKDINLGPVDDWSTHEGKAVLHTRPSKIYHCED